ncbi:MAG: division/cell wall cluster transcriptional repressor MraZ [Lachnospiraceae bacterium]|nr:division/cell wall cluster transcriptional repressor MraZ [Lachnospiraceae bacterium]
MFMGEYNHTIDAKGRLIVPTKFREQLGEAFVVAKGNDGCLAIYTNKDWENFLGKIQSLPANNHIRTYVRNIVGSAVEVTTDKQGRILVPGNLREHAGLEKDVVLAGVIDKIEVWDKERWGAQTGIDNMDDIAEEMAGLGLSI